MIVVFVVVEFRPAIISMCVTILFDPPTLTHTQNTFIIIQLPLLYHNNTATASQTQCATHTHTNNNQIISLNLISRDGK